MDTPRTAGIHHVTTVTADLQRTLDFYTGTLGLRLVKRTVNFDDPTTYHCYLGDAVGTPGTLLTFFARPDARPGEAGVGQARTVAFRVPPDATEYWYDRLVERGIVVDGPYERFDERVLAFRDPDGLELELVARPDAGPGDESDDGPIEPWGDGPVPEPRAIRGIDGVSVAVAAADPTADFLRDLGFDPGATDRGRRRFRATSDRASVVDVSETPGGRLGHGGTGVVHHVAVRAADAPTLRAYREALAERGGRVTAVIDRHYFESVYVREPGGVLFEVATDGPGVTADEPRDALGSSLALPDWLADDRASIEADLPDPYRPSGGATDGRE